MHPHSDATISIGGLLYGGEGAEVYVLFTVSNVGSVADAMLVDFDTNPLGENSGGSSVCSVLPVSCFSKIGKSIVASVAIDVINLILRPFSGYIKPHKSMIEIGFSVYSDLPMTLFRGLKISSPISWTNPTGAIFRGIYPKEVAGINVISKGIAKLFGGKLLVHANNSYDKYVVC